MNAKSVSVKFSGDNTTDGETNIADPGAFWDSMSLALRGNPKIENDVQRLSAFGLSLTGTAARWFNLNSKKSWLYPETDTENAKNLRVTWQEIGSQFLKRFRPSGFDEAIENAVKNCAQRKNETVQQFSERLEELMNNLSDEQKKRYPDDGLNIFISGLRKKHDLQKDVRKESPKTRAGVGCSNPI